MHEWVWAFDCESLRFLQLFYSLGCLELLRLHIRADFEGIMERYCISVDEVDVLGCLEVTLVGLGLLSQPSMRLFGTFE